jgi:hypothetical protein
VFVDSSIIRVAVLSGFQFSAIYFFRNSFSAESAYHGLENLTEQISHIIIDSFQAKWIKPCALL